MYYEYWIKWFLTLLLKLFLIVSVGFVSVALFLGGINNKNILPIIIGLMMNIFSLMLIINFAKTIFIPWKGIEEEYIPFYTKNWESYATYRKRMDSEKISKNN